MYRAPIIVDGESQTRLFTESSVDKNTYRKMNMVVTPRNEKYPESNLITNSEPIDINLMPSIDHKVHRLKFTALWEQQQNQEKITPN